MTLRCKCERGRGGMGRPLILQDAYNHGDETIADGAYEIRDTAMLAGAKRPSRGEATILGTAHSLAQRNNCAQGFLKIILRDIGSGALRAEGGNCAWDDLLVARALAAAPCSGEARGWSVSCLTAALKSTVSV